VRRHAERVDVVLSIELLKFKRLVALIAIKNKQPTRPNHLALCMLNEVSRVSEYGMDAASRLRLG
jgi:hypothetical protein